jgi:hypothetical protein
MENSKSLTEMSEVSGETFFQTWEKNVGQDLTSYLNKVGLTLLYLGAQAS